MKRIDDEVKNKIIIIETILILIISIIIFILLLSKEDTSTNNSISFLEVTTTTSKVSVSDEYYVDIKGSVKKPGVYLVSKGSIVNDVINLAGGLKTNAYTANINLSQPTTESMVIYIYSNSEIKKLTTPVLTNTTCSTQVIEVNNCISTTTTKTTTNSTNASTSKININTATLDQLMTLSGIGQSKAEDIISYRNETKFNSIEDIKNVSGIGDALYAKIKDDITV